MEPEWKSKNSFVFPEINEVFQKYKISEWRTQYRSLNLMDGDNDEIDNDDNENES
jgi:hypothetical protein